MMLDKTVARFWDLDAAEGVEMGTTGSAWLFAGRGVVKSFADEEAFAKHDIIAAGIYRAGLNAPTVIEGAEGRFCRQNGCCYALTALVEGEPAPAVTAENAVEQAYILGQDIALLHRILQRFDTAYAWQTAAMPAVETQLCARFNGLESAYSRLQGLYGGLSVQLVHGDAHPGNRLQKQGGLSGWVDFDAACRNARIADSCYGAIALVSPLLKSNTDLALALLPQVIAALFAGYDDALRMTYNEKIAVPAWMVCRQAAALKWFADNDYEEDVRACTAVLQWLCDNFELLPMLLPQ